jgi:hypothetical protein
MSDSNQKLNEPLQEPKVTAKSFKSIASITSPSPEPRRTLSQDSLDLGRHPLSLSHIYIDNISSHRMDKDMRPIPGLDQTLPLPVGPDP